MAVAANEIQLTITNRLPIGSGRAIYLGTAQGGTEYTETGGAELGEEATNSRWKLPGKIDVILQLGAVVLKLLGTGKVELFVAGAEKKPNVKLKDKETMAGMIPAGTPFAFIADQ